MTAPDYEKIAKDLDFAGRPGEDTAGMSKMATEINELLTRYTATIRRAALEDAAKVVCCWCRIGFNFTRDGRAHVHSDGLRASRCPASAIHDLLAAEPQPPEAI